MGKYTKEKLKELQSLPLEDKIFLSQQRIEEWYEHWGGAVFVAFSGGKDSTVLLHIVRNIFPDVKAVYIDTGLEYPEVKQFVKTFDNVDIIRPKMPFNQVIKEYGWVFPSKEGATTIEYARKGSVWAKNKLEGLNADGSYSKYQQRYKKWKFLENAPVKISAKCCKIMKKDTVLEYKRKTGNKCILGTMAEESTLRRNSWLLNGCNAFNTKRPISQPLSFWTFQDILRYIKLNNLSIPSVYGDIVEEKGKLRLTGIERTGCVFCPIGCHLENPSHIKLLKETHPKLYDYCLNTLGLKELLDYVGKELKKELY